MQPHLGTHRLDHQLRRFAEATAPRQPERLGSAHDMLVMTSRPDLTPEFPPGLRHPTQTAGAPTRLEPRP